MEAFLVTTLGKGVVYAKDTPNFIGNRIGVFSILSTIHHTQQFGGCSAPGAAPSNWNIAPAAT
ncbi:hypothetical protein [Stenotrophomonas maltophilia]|uniref:hypothetical protein n=1 Tax=Stenotrophomonas maltophilia TaxID=40324 RepID=UPI002893EA14|nr:hypothetical protein [Stenotrophomonas maltophilia]MDT3474624.1 hypothetical protein [Stenotrophomonas maltophilia]